MDVMMQNEEPFFQIPFDACGVLSNLVGALSQSHGQQRRSKIIFVYSYTHDNPTS